MAPVFFGLLSASQKSKEYSLLWSVKKDKWDVDKWEEDTSGKKTQRTVATSLILVLWVCGFVEPFIDKSISGRFFFVYCYSWDLFYFLFFSIFIV